MKTLLALAAGGLPAAASPPSQDRYAPVGVGYQPADKDERGQWMQVEQFERPLKQSDFVIRDPALNKYVQGPLCRTIGAAECGAVRLYLVRTADLNASMAPNGLMMVNTGLLLRVRDEAQLAVVLGHEWTHYSRRHQIRGWRDMRTRATMLARMALVPVASYAAYAALSAAQIGSIFRFSREMEQEADAGLVPLMTRADYDPHEAPRIWEQLRDEQDATAAARKKRSRKDDNGGLFAAHPPTRERVAALRPLADAWPVPVPVPATAADGRVAYRAAMRPWYPALIDDQIKLNDFGATEYLLTNLGRDGWTLELLYVRGELCRTRGRPEDLTAAGGYYREAIAAGSAPLET